MTNFQTIILAAGSDEDFILNGYESKLSFPVLKNGMSMLEYTLSRYYQSQRIVLVASKENEIYLQSASVGALIKILNKRTQGALASIGLSLDLIEDNVPILVAPIDGIADIEIEDFIEEMLISNCFGGAIVFRSEDSNFSYLRLKESEVIEVAEKRKIGEYANTGIFYFKNKENLISAIEWAMVNRANLDGVWYMSLALNYFITKRLKFGAKIIDASAYHRFSNVSYAEKSRMEID